MTGRYLITFVLQLYDYIPAYDSLAFLNHDSMIESELKNQASSSQLSFDLTSFMRSIVVVERSCNVLMIHTVYGLSGL